MSEVRSNPFGELVARQVGPDEWVSGFLREGESDLTQIGTGSTRDDAIASAHKTAAAALLFVFLATAVGERVISKLPRSMLLGLQRHDQPQTDPDPSERTVTGVADVISGGLDLVVAPSPHTDHRFGWRIVFESRSDGSYDFDVYDTAAKRLHVSGNADDWDTAKLEAIVNLVPPSDDVLEWADENE